MTRVPTRTPLLGLPPEMACGATIVQSDVRQRVRPGRRLREAQPQGDQAAFSPQQVLGGGSPGEMTPRLLETTTAEVPIRLGRRPPWWRQGRTQMGCQGHGDLLHVGTHGHAFVLPTAWSQGGHERQHWRWRCLTARVSVQEVCPGVNPTAQHDERLTCLLNARPPGSPT